MVAVAVVLVVEVAIDQVVNVVAMGDRFVAAVRPVNVGGVMAGAGVTTGAVGRIGSRDFQDVLIVVAFVGGMEVAIVEVIHVVLVRDGRVAASRTVNVIVIFVNVVGHKFFLGDEMDLALLQGCGSGATGWRLLAG